jgi:cellobiose phosphorylase
MAADVYNVNPHVGRGGWTWYTGSAGWMYKVGLEDILGFKKEGNRLYINPCIPRKWDKYTIKYRYKNTRYNILIKNPYKVNRGVNYIMIDGNKIAEKYILLQNDGGEHLIEVILGSYRDS